MQDFDDEDLKTEAEPMINVGKSDIANYQEEKEKIHKQIELLKQMSTTDDPAVQSKFEEILALTAKPEHIRMEHRMSIAKQAMESAPEMSHVLVPEDPNSEQLWVQPSSYVSDDSDEFLDAYMSDDEDGSKQAEFEKSLKEKEQ